MPVDAERIPLLRGRDMDSLEIVENAWLRVVNGVFAGWGSMDSFPATDGSEEIVDACGGAVMPSFCDSHTHIVYAGSREREFVDKIHGLSYEEIARRGGGILNSADLLRITSENELFRQAMERADEIMAKGTGCVEIKSGYGLKSPPCLHLPSDPNGQSVHLHAAVTHQEVIFTIVFQRSPHPVGNIPVSVFHQSLNRASAGVIMPSVRLIPPGFVPVQPAHFPDRKRQICKLVPHFVQVPHDGLQFLQ